MGSESDKSLLLELAVEMEKKIKDLSKDFQGEPPTIFKVHPSIRDQDPKAYEPHLISIGPYHRDKNIARENLKWKYLNDLRDRNPEQVSLHRYISALWPHEPTARKCYADNVEINKKKFVEMLVLDGCFIIEFFIKVAQGSLETHFKDVKWNIPLLRNDLLLLENQIPFFVLQILFDESNVLLGVGGKQLDIADFAVHFISASKMQFLPNEYREKKIFHLLHLSHIYQLHGFDPTRASDASRSSCIVSMMKQIKSFLMTFFYCVVSILLMWKIPRFSKKKPKRNPRTIPSASKLTRAGMKFAEKTSKCCILVVTYKDGRIAMPRLTVDQKLMPILRNLIVFEQCCLEIPYRFSAYAVLMDNLIDIESDVTVLEEQRVLESKLGSNKEVAEFINKLCIGTHMNYQDHYLANVFRDIWEFYDSEEHQWRANLVQDYFGNPWATISFLAALALLVFTALQTVYTIIK